MALTCACACTDGVVQVGGIFLVELEDVAQHYRRPSIIDIKVGYQTWYPSADPSHIQRCQTKDAATTQAALGFKVCGMQVSPSLYIPVHSLHLKLISLFLPSLVQLRTVALASL